MAKQVDWSQAQMRHIAIRLIYLGWEYQGLACLGEGRPSVEAALFKALRAANLIPHGSTVPETWEKAIRSTAVDRSAAMSGFTRAGRTDAGVSSTFQVCSLYVRSVSRTFDSDCVGYIAPGTLPTAALPAVASLPVPLPSHPRRADEDEMNYVAAINAYLPRDLRVVSWAAVPTSFSARFSATSRRYEYYFTRHELDVQAMRKAADFLLGRHDFRNFCRIDVENARSWEREVHEVMIEPVSEQLPDLSTLEGDEATIKRVVDAFINHPSALWRFSIRGNAFLWHQVRCMVAILLAVGRGLEKPEIVQELLTVDNNDTGFTSKPSYQMAPEHPLCLVECLYAHHNPVWVADAGAALRAGAWGCAAAGRHASAAAVLGKVAWARLLPAQEAQGMPLQARTEAFSDLFINGGRYVPLRARGREPSLESRLACKAGAARPYNDDGENEE